MNRSLYISAIGMTTQMKKMDVVTNNIANVNTTGFKKDGVATRTFDEERKKVEKKQYKKETARATNGL